MKEVPFMITNNDLILINNVLDINENILNKLELYKKYININETKNIILNISMEHKNQINKIIDILK